MSSSGRDAVRAARRVVVKIGTNALTSATGRFNRAHFEALGEDLLWAAQGRELVVVSSGAIALGVERLGLPARPKDIPGKQACAAVGQSRLMQAYEEAFGKADRRVAQVLLTHGDVQDRRRYLNVKHALDRLIEAGVVPIINENDTVSVD
ncbi:MAG TPA: glutamate 5-kinase, partial [Archangium sp.]|nr:glutamate 5-kinase [Archangium sp.]